jgi:hypothetical protein
VAARGAGQVGRDAGQAGPRDPRHVLAMSADLDKAQAEGVELDVGTRYGRLTRLDPVG